MKALSELTVCVCVRVCAERAKRLGGSRTGLGNPRRTLDQDPSKPFGEPFGGPSACFPHQAQIIHDQGPSGTAANALWAVLDSSRPPCDMGGTREA